jgi:aspartate racemase
VATPKHIGIAAVSAEGAALCYRTICAEGAAVLGPHTHPEITMHTYPLATYMEYSVGDHWKEMGQLLLRSAEKLAGAGADFLICPDNTIHQALDLVRDDSPLPWLHIAEEVATVADERGFRRLAILGTRNLMEGPVYPARLSPKGIEYELPSPEERGRIHEVIFDELVYGRIEPSSQRYFQDVIGRLAGNGCDAVVLGCTEIPLLIGESDSPLPTLNSTRTLALAALREATRDGG